MTDGLRYYKVGEVAELIKVSARWLADECRAGRVEHVHIARKRRFTDAQVAKLMAKHTVAPEATPADEARIRAERNLNRRRSRER